MAGVSRSQWRPTVAPLWRRERASLVCRIQAGRIEANASISLIEGNGALLRDPEEVGRIASKYYQVSADDGTYDTIAFHGVYVVPANHVAETRYLANVQCRVDPTQELGGKTESSKEGVLINRNGGLASWGVSSPRRVSVEVVETKEAATRKWADKATDTVIRFDKNKKATDYPIDGRVGYGLSWTALPDPMKLSFTTSKQKTSVLVLADLMQQDPCYYGVCTKRKRFSTGKCTTFRVLVDGQTVAMSEGGAEITVAIRGVALELSAGEHTAEVQYRTNAGSLLFPVVGAERESHRRLTVLQGDYSWCQNVKQWTRSTVKRARAPAAAELATYTAPGAPNGSLLGLQSGARATFGTNVVQSWSLSEAPPEALWLSLRLPLRIVSDLQYDLPSGEAPCTAALSLRRPCPLGPSHNSSPAPARRDCVCAQRWSTLGTV